MRIKDFDPILCNGQKVIVREDTEKITELFCGYPFMGGFEVDPNIEDWRKLKNRKVTLISSTQEDRKYYSQTVIVLWVEPKEGGSR